MNYSNSIITDDTKDYFKNGLSNLIENIDIDYKSLLPKKDEIFIQKVLKDNSGELIVNEAIHNSMHRFIRKAKAKGFNKYLCLGGFPSEKRSSYVSTSLECENPNIIKIVHVSDEEAKKEPDQ